MSVSLVVLLSLRLLCLVVTKVINIFHIVFRHVVADILQVFRRAVGGAVVSLPLFIVCLSFVIICQP